MDKLDNWIYLHIMHMKNVDLYERRVSIDSNFVNSLEFLPTRCRRVDHSVFTIKLIFRVFLSEVMRSIRPFTLQTSNTDNCPRRRNPQTHTLSIGRAINVVESFGYIRCSCVETENEGAFFEQFLIELLDPCHTYWVFGADIRRRQQSTHTNA